MNLLSVRAVARGMCTTGRCACGSPRPLPRSARRRCPRAGAGRGSRTGRSGSWRAGSRVSCASDEQADLPAQLAEVLLELDVELQRHAEDLHADPVAGRCPAGADAVDSGDHARRAVVLGELGGRREPHDLAVVLDLRSPGVGAAGDQPRPRPKVRSSSSVLVHLGGRRAGSGASSEESRTSIRGCSAVPRTRTWIGGSPCRRALVTSSETPSSAHSTRSSRPMSVHVRTTHRRASCTPRGPEPKVRAGRFSGTGIAPGWSRRENGTMQSAAVAFYPAVGEPNMQASREECSYSVVKPC